MEYEDIRRSIKSGDLVAFSHGGWTSWSSIESQIVKFATKSKFTHVAIVWAILDRLFVIEAVVPEIRIFPLSNFKEFYLLQSPIGMSKSAEDYAISRVGQKYSKIEAIRGYFGKTREDNYWQCAEFVKSVLSKEGVFLKSKATPVAIIEEVASIFDSKLELITNKEVRI